LLDELIYASGSGWTYFITNVVACLPLKTYGKDIIRVPTDEEAAACNPRLQAVIEMAVPKGLVLLGKVAKRYARNLKVERRLELVHPSFILRNGGVTSLEFKIAKRKLTQFVKELQS
jgi:uracil-DNA glycosylase family 4